MVDGGGYAMFILIFAGTSYLLVEDHGWPLAIFIFALETAILVLGDKLVRAKDEVRSLSHILKQERDESLVKWRPEK